MKTAIVYGSTHGRTAKVTDTIARELKMPPDIFRAKEITDAAVFEPYDLLLFCCPTYGDEELQVDMEDFLLRVELKLAGKLFAICELGSYYGYDDFSFGAMRVIRGRLLEAGGTEVCQPLSLDSFPKVNWDHLLTWVDYLNGRIYERSGCCSH